MSIDTNNLIWLSTTNSIFVFDGKSVHLQYRVGNREKVELVGRIVQYNRQLFLFRNEKRSLTPINEVGKAARSFSLDSFTDASIYSDEIARIPQQLRNKTLAERLPGIPNAGIGARWLVFDSKENGYIQVDDRLYYATGNQTIDLGSGYHKPGGNFFMLRDTFHILKNHQLTSWYKGSAVPATIHLPSVSTDDGIDHKALFFRSGQKTFYQDENKLFLLDTSRNQIHFRLLTDALQHQVISSIIIPPGEHMLLISTATEGQNYPNNF